LKCKRLTGSSKHSQRIQTAAGGGLCWLSVLSCLLLACSYVGSLYVWRSDLPRDHPAVIKRRFTSVLIVSGLSPLFVWCWREFTAVRVTPLFSLLGIRLEGFIPAIVLPLLLTMVLFLGPLMQLAMDCPWSLMDGIGVALDPCFWTLCFSDMRWLRNQVVAPLTEELVFRACMLPMLVPCAGPLTAIFTCPLFFGVAHFHHVIELLRFRQATLSGILLSAVFQFSYTAVFGAYTAFIFIRTGELSQEQCWLFPLTAICYVQKRETESTQKRDFLPVFAEGGGSFRFLLFFVGFLWRSLFISRS
uniref:CAAX prenyl protease 2 n=1 Tax=Cyprinodon variegatus TaxID=28743 RepID=A0A3Q2DTI3_CYPVA